MNALRIAYLRQRVNYISNIARKRAYTNTIVQALNLTVVFQCPPERWQGFFGFVTSFACPKEVTKKRAKKTMLPRTGRPHPRRFFKPTHKED